MEITAFLAELPTEQRLALAYANARSRSRFAALFLLDTRLAGIVRRAGEPLLGQLQLAWWRDQLALAPQARPSGEPLLALLEQWHGEEESLIGLVDGWELLLSQDEPGGDALDRHARARAATWAGLARLCGAAEQADEAQRMGRNWAIADLASRIGPQFGQGAALDLADRQDWRAARLPGGLRPFAVLHGLASRKRGRAPLLDGPLALAAAVRLGLTGG